MTTAVPPLLPTVEQTRIDRWRDALLVSPRGYRLWRWLAPLLVTVVAAVLRLIDIGNPHQLVFDETYYVKDSWSQWVLGYPSTWEPDDTDARFAAGQTDIFTGIGSYVVHPPLGRILIGAGMALFGPDSATGWRISAAVFGTATVLLVYLVARTLTRSIPFATVASGLIAIDGLGIVLSRIALLDIFLTFFILLTFWFVALDHLRTGDRIAELVARRGERPMWGPILWNRPWLIAAGTAAGAATAVKWSGLYVLAAIGVYAVVTDALARRRAGVVQWPMDAVRQGLASFVLLVPVALVVYLASWSGWLFTSGGYMRSTPVATSPLWSWVPEALQRLWAYHQAMYAFHVGLVTPHSYASPAWQWPLLIRPTSMYWHQDAAGVNGCTLPTGCTEAISSLANPIIWWAGIAASVFLLVRFVMVRDWRYALVLTGLAATYVPWLLYPERTIFQFYTVAMLPFLVIALTFALREIASPARAASRVTGQVGVLVFLGFCVVVSAFWYPVWAGLPVSYEFWRLHNWLPTWI
ncbi:phospholipid carrier-dependent glycosyltransferase [Microbacterium sp. JC 701]|uniref:dolichyl-phosphate-mannose--protein mannosyltransferase n=1 Tax=Microbacterium sp. JC 701 TaxID=2897389 RepID=UPI001E569375|nr:phospholipid carrier-dependent glycosyltransferase [Microbacterium sp. JC 701]MCD2171291.1 phospholipid carrier-dependent glycosyltransferase [Microbacterium sp. JC 701]